MVLQRRHLQFYRNLALPRGTTHLVRHELPNLGLLEGRFLAPLAVRRRRALVPHVSIIKKHISSLAENQLHSSISHYYASKMRMRFSTMISPRSPVSESIPVCACSSPQRSNVRLQLGALLFSRAELRRRDAPSRGRRRHLSFYRTRSLPRGTTHHVSRSRGSVAGFARDGPTDGHARTAAAGERFGRFRRRLLELGARLAWSSLSRSSFENFLISR